MGDWYPGTIEGDLEFFTNYSAELDVVGPEMGMTPAQILDDQNFVAPFITKLEEVVAARHALAVSTGGYALLFDVAAIAELRQRVNAQKARPLWNHGMGDALHTNTTPAPTHIFQPTKLRGESTHGNNRLFANKDGAERVNIYARVVGDIDFELIGAKIKKLPYNDRRLPRTVGARSEAREYQLFAVEDDEESGLGSNICQLTWIA